MALTPNGVQLLIDVLKNYDPEPHEHMLYDLLLLQLMNAAKK
jgi:hypothetical protein